MGGPLHLNGTPDRETRQERRLCRARPRRHQRRIRRHARPFPRRDRRRRRPRRPRHLRDPVRLPRPTHTLPHERRLRRLPRQAPGQRGARRQRFADANAAVSADADVGRGYGADLRLSPTAGLAPGRLEADAYRTLPVGALSLVGLGAPSVASRHAAPSLAGDAEAEPHVSAWRRFEVLRRAGSGEVVLELFPPPKPTGASTPSLRPRPLALPANASQAPRTVRLQVLRRPHRPELPPRPDRDRGAERVREEQRRRRGPLGPRRAARAVDARRRDGGRDLQGIVRPAGHVRGPRRPSCSTTRRACSRRTGTRSA